MKITKQAFTAYLIPLILFLIAFIWKLVFIETRNICIDEPFTIFHAQQSALDIIKLSTQNEPNPPLFMLLEHFWIDLFGISSLSVRMLPLLFNALTVIYIFFIGKKFFNPWCGIFASGIFILSTNHFYFGLEARTYSLLSLATAASLFYFLSLIQNYNNKKLLAALVIANFVLTYCHFFGWFVVFVQFATSFIYIKDRKLFKMLLLSIIITGVSFSPMAIIFIKQFFISSHGTWVQPPSNSEYLSQLYWFLNAKRVFIFILISILAGSIFMIGTKNYKKISNELLILFLWWFIPYTIMFLISSKIPMFINRYILFNSIGLYLFIAAIITFLYKKTYLYIISTIILVLMLLNIQINSKEFFYREVKNSADFVKRNANSNSIVIIYPHWAAWGFVYYYNNEIFKNAYDFDSVLKKNNIFPVWNIDYAKDYISKNQDKRILYYQDGSTDYKAIVNYLDSTYRRVDSAFYPQCFNVFIYDPLSKDTSQSATRPQPKKE